MSLFARQYRSAMLLAAALLVPALRSPLAAQQTKAGAPTVAEAIAFADSAEAVLLDLAVRAERAAWIQSTYITEDRSEERRVGRASRSAWGGGALSRAWHD